MRYTIGFILLTLLLGACQEKGSLEIKFLATYDGEPLVLAENVDYDNYQINFLESDFYISEVALVNGNEITEVKDIDFVDFTATNFNLENAENGFALRYDNIDAGSYSGIRFGIGIPPVENATVPADYNSDNILSQGGYYWEAWSSFIFAKLAGKYQDTEGSFDNGFFFHTGTDELFRTNEGEININITEDNTTVIEVIIDHKELLEETSGTFYDIQNNSSNHDPLEPGPLLMLVNNYSDAIRYNQ